MSTEINEPYYISRVVVGDKDVDRQFEDGTPSWNMEITVGARSRSTAHDYSIFAMPLVVAPGAGYVNNDFPEYVLARRSFISLRNMRFKVRPIFSDETGLTDGSYSGNIRVLLYYDGHWSDPDAIVHETFVTTSKEMQVLELGDVDPFIVEAGKNINLLISLADLNFPAPRYAFEFAASIKIDQDIDGPNF